MPIGICKLCLREKELRSSHFIPRGVYSYLRNECEQLLSRRGEVWVLPRLAEFDGAFPFSTLLRTQPPLFDETDVQVYAVAKNPVINRSALIHFALGIFWKASVHSWKGSTTEPRIDLGTHSEALRKYLRDGGSFPGDMALALMVMPTPVRMICCFDPIRGSNPEFENFHFYVPGLFFSLGVGNVEDVKAMCLVSNPQGIVLVQDMTPQLTDLYRKAAKTAHKSKRLLEPLKNRKDIIGG